MKQLLVYFLIITLCVTVLPIAAHRSIAADGGMTVSVFINGAVCEMPLEEYVLRVLAHEQRGIENEECLKALAVAARSCGAYLSLYGCKHDDFDACADGSCCIALGEITDIDKASLTRIKNAADSTRGEVLICDGSPALSLFCICTSRGSRESKEFEYLPAVAEESECVVHMTERVFNASELKDKLGLVDGESDCLVYTENGKCEFGVFGGRMVTGDELAMLLDLPSTELAIEKGDGESVCRSYGVGHGYGLSLCGGDRMASAGFDYIDIVEKYFPELKLNKMYND
ncbi:MAG: hypothetical protein IKK70_05045 [Clostridia bacterium]|nr:hypothetical protein [Clostridia bacterium]